MRFLKLGLVAVSFLYIYATGATASSNKVEAAKLVKAQLGEDIGASERVEAATLLRILSQETASAACHMGKGVDRESSRKLLIEAKTKFGMILDSLQHGNPKMNIIGGEERRKTVMKIEALRTNWAPVHDAAVQLIDDNDNTEALLLIKAQNEDILAMTYELASDIAGEYSNPAELIQADVMLMDFSGRQALLTQKMAKIACEIWSGNRSEDRISLLRSVMQTYDLTLTALRDGMPAVGIIAAPTPEIEAALDAARISWTRIKAELEDLMAADEFADESKKVLYNDLNAAMYEMEEIEHLYVAYTKHNYD